MTLSEILRHTQYNEYDFNDVEGQTYNTNVLRVLQYYRITREDAEQAMLEKGNIR